MESLQFINMDSAMLLYNEIPRHPWGVTLNDYYRSWLSIDFDFCKSHGIITHFRKGFVYGR